MLKKCTKCQETKPVADFNRRAKSLDGLMPKCRVCCNKYDTARYINDQKKKDQRSAWLLNNKDKAHLSEKKWRQANPEKVVAAHARYVAANKPIVAKYKAKYRAKNAEKIAEYNANWKLANPEATKAHWANKRARKRACGGRLSAGLAKKLFEYQRGKCACGCKQPLGVDYHLDHIMPLALGGSNTDDNIQLLRAKCNLQKHAKHPVEFMQQRGFLL